MMRHRRNAIELRCWECNKPVLIDEGIMPSSFERECYHDACYPVSVNKSGGYFPGGMSPLPDDILARKIDAAIAANQSGKGGE